MAWFFTCRHEYESVLADELGRLGSPRPQVVMPGLVRADIATPPTQAALLRWDPVYALQVLPHVTEISGSSISALADAVLANLPEQWATWPGRWQIHALVPGQLKGQPKPLMRRRADLVADALRGKLAPLSGPKTTKDQSVGRLLQILLLDNDHGLVSASPVIRPALYMAWPALQPAGLADPPDDDRAPSSAFRKLREALACMNESPQPGQMAADLGACPGGWTHVLRQCGAHVTAIDRSPLAKHLMHDAQVRFVQGDAFTWRSESPLDWVVSDVIAYPERVLELVEAWCKPEGAKRLILQMKFKGDPQFELIDCAIATARERGFVLRAKHFFNDKHEVTLMGGRQEEP